jgi:hypothetical protein
MSPFLKQQPGSAAQEQTEISETASWALHCTNWIKESETWTNKLGRSSPARRSLFFEEKKGEKLKSRDCGVGETSKSVAPAKRARKQSLSQRILELKYGGAGYNPTAPGSSVISFLCLPYQHFQQILPKYNGYGLD